MQKRLAIALGAIIGISSAQSSQAESKKSVAVVPLMVPRPANARGAVAPNSVQNVAAIRKALNNTYPSSHMQKGLALKQQGNIDAALLEFLKESQEHPTNVRAFYEQALIFKQKGYTKLAQSAVQQALAVRPDFRDARVLLASVFLDSGDLSGAARELVASLSMPVKPAKPVTTSEPARLPSLIQTPHGQIKLPLPLAQSAPSGVAGGVNSPRSTSANAAPAPRSRQAEQTNADAFASPTEKSGPDLSALLKGIPGVDPEAGEVGSAFSDATSAEKNQVQVATAVPPGAAEQAAAESDSDKDSGASTSRRRKTRVAAWLDMFLDGRHEINPQALTENIHEELGQKPDPEEQKPERAAQQTPPVVSVEPAPVVENAAPGFFDFLKQPLATLFNLNRSEHKEQAPPVPSTQAQMPPPPVPVAPVPAQPSFVKRAVSWLPLPVFKPLAQHKALPAPDPERLAPIALSPPLPAMPQPPVVRRSPEAPRLGPQATAAINTFVPTPAHNSGQVGLPAPQPAPIENPLDSVLKILPQDLAASVQRIIAPAPVDIAAQTAGAPMVKDVPVHVTGNYSAPRPVSSNTAAPEYENLVVAQVHDNMPKAPVPVKPQGHEAELPRPLSPAPVVAHAVAPPVPIRHGGIAATTPQPIPGAHSHRGSVLPVLPASSADHFEGDITPAQPSLPSPRLQGAMPPAPAAARVASGSMHGQPQHPDSLDHFQQAPVAAAINAVRPTSTPSPDPVPVRATAQSGQAAAPHPMSAGAAPVDFAVTPVAQRLASQGFQFMAPALTTNKQYVVNTAKNAPPPVQAKPAAKPAEPPLPDDDFARRMKYLLANGTHSLGPGEAFMFSEETGEGVLFLRGGGSVRRKIARPREAEEVARLRRPELLAPQGDLQYNLSLLGKIIVPNKPTESAAHPPSVIPPAPGLTVKDLLQKNEGFMGWFKNVFKF